MNRVIACLAVCLVAGLASPAAAELRFEVQQLDERVAIGYAVLLADLNEDGKPDIIVVDRERVVWFENPTWKMHTILQGQTRPDNVCIDAYDITGNGKLDLALGADWTLNTRSGGTIGWLARGERPQQPFTLHPIGEEPTVHRLRFADLDGDGRKELVVVPLMGRDSTRPHFAESGVRVLAYKIPDDPVRDPWVPQVINDELHVTHNFWPCDLTRDGKTDILITSFEGVSLLRRAQDGTWKRTLLGRGNQETSPNRGASEVKLGRLAGGRDYIAAIEPWHGHQVVVYTPPQGASPAEAAERLWDRHVIDEDLQWGHAVWCVDLDGDGDEELVIGVRDDRPGGGRRGLRIYDPNGPEPAKWQRHLIDAGGVAIEDLAAADLDGDGKPDIVAVGRATNNIRIYWNRSP